MSNETTPSATGSTIRIARVVPAAPADLWRCWTDPTIKKQWWGRTEKTELDVCDLNVHVGGRFHYGMRLPGRSEPQTADGEYVELSPPNRLVFTWSARGGAVEVKDTKATVEFTDLKDGSSRVTVTHERLPSPAVASHQVGWSDALQDLATWCSK